MVYNKAMSEIIKATSNHPLFKPTLFAGVTSIVSGAKSLILLGFQIDAETVALLKQVEAQLRGVAYDSTNLDELLAHAQAMGDDLGKTREENPQAFGEQETND